VRKSVLACECVFKRQTESSRVCVSVCVCVFVFVTERECVRVLES
jgi:hypothetical protein